MTPMFLLLRWAIRLGVAWVINALAILFLAWILPGFEIPGIGTAFVMAAVIAILGATIRPLLVWAALRLIILTGGLLSVVISALVVVLAAFLVEDIELSFWAGLAVVLFLGLVNAVAGAFLPFDDDLSYFRGVVRLTGRRNRSAYAADTPGLVMFEIDGLGEPILRRAIAAGLVPTIQRWMRDGSHELVGWECDLSSQTGASQAGLLHGDNSGMPLFRWFEKDTGRVMVSNHPADAAEIESGRRGTGLLAGGGSAIGNMFSGGAEQSMVTMSRVSDNYSRRIPAFYTYFADPQNYARALYLSIHDIWLEKTAAWGQKRRDERPRVDRSGKYPLVRAATTVALRELGVYLMIAEMYRGVPAMYATFVGYDEVAHHSGPERPDTLQVLRRLDKQLARLERAARGAPRPYRFVVLSDHGQSPGTPFRQQYGETIDELVGRLAGHDGAVTGGGLGDEGIGAVTVAVTEVGDRSPASATRIARTQLAKAEAETGQPSADAAEAAQDADEDAPIVMVSGGLGAVYLPAIPGRAERSAIDEAHPGLIDGLAAHEGIAWVMVRDGADGAVVHGRSGRVRLSDGLVEGDDPLAGFGRNALHHLRRTDGFHNCPDILMNGRYDPRTGDVTAFEEFTGSHGGLGGDQMHPFLLHPADLSVGDDELLGAAAVHAVLMRWREELHGPVVAPPEAEAATPGAG